MISSPKVSIIIPVYKVRNFIKKCVCSLMEQTLQEVEYIFVDDASPDDSIKIVASCIKYYPHRIGQVTIITHQHNQGLPAARNTGLAEAKGEFIYHCDSDDFLEPSMLEEMYNTAKVKNADIVYCDFYLSFESNERYMRNPDYKTSDDMLRKGMLGGCMKYNVWNKLVLKKLYEDNNITFPTGYAMGEDMTMIRLVACARDVAFVPKAFYHYVKQNTNAYSNTLSAKHLNDIKYNAEQTIRFLKSIYGDTIDMEINFFKLNTKLPFIITDQESLYGIWNKWWPESNKCILKNRQQSLRIRLLQLFADKKMFWVLKLYYMVVYKFVYGLIFR